MTEQLSLTTQKPQRPAGRHPDDFYATPGWCVRALLDAYTPGHPADGIFEPAAGDGAILDVVAAVLPEYPRAGFEMNMERSAEARRRGHDVTCRDFLRWAPTIPQRAWVLGNPPFRLAQEFVEHALASFAPGSEVTYLLRLGFLASKRRAHLFAPGAGFAHLHVLPRRPSFTPDGGTDQYDYGWFTWRQGWTGNGTVSHLPVP